jgi:hypothetical protein
VRPFGLGNGEGPLSLGVKIVVGMSGDCEDCAVGGKIVGLLRRLARLWQRWWRWIGFWVVLLAGVT